MITTQINGITLTENAIEVIHRIYNRLLINIL